MSSSQHKSPLSAGSNGRSPSPSTDLPTDTTQLERVDSSTSAASTSTREEEEQRQRRRELLKDSTFSGQMEDGLPHGLGTLVDSIKGTRTFGTFEYGVPVGYGRATNLLVPHGRNSPVEIEARYVGELMNGKPHGNGVLLSTPKLVLGASNPGDVRKYSIHQGHFFFGQPWGQGRMQVRVLTTSGPSMNEDPTVVGPMSLMALARQDFAVEAWEEGHYEQGRFKRGNLMMTQIPWMPHAEPSKWSLVGAVGDRKNYQMTCSTTNDVVHARYMQYTFSSTGITLNMRYSTKNGFMLYRLHTMPLLDVNNNPIVIPALGSEDATAPDENLTCVICSDQQRNVVFQPCGHLASCIACSAKLGECPICRSKGQVCVIALVDPNLAATVNDIAKPCCMDCGKELQPVLHLPCTACHLDCTNCSVGRPCSVCGVETVDARPVILA